MKKKASNPSPDKRPPKEFELRIDRDLLGVLPMREWSCLTLDVADILAPKLGPKALELYYWIAQHQEAGETKYEYEGEAEIAALFRDILTIPVQTKGAEIISDLERLKGYMTIRWG